MYIFHHSYTIFLSTYCQSIFAYLVVGANFLGYVILVESALLKSKFWAGFHQGIQDTFCSG